MQLQKTLFVRYMLSFLFNPICYIPPPPPPPLYNFFLTKHKRKLCWYPNLKESDGKNLFS